MSIEELRKMGIETGVTPESLAIENFLLYVSDRAAALSFSANEKMQLTRAYHRLWWFREKNIKKYFPKDERYKKLPAFVFPEFQSEAEIDLENLIAKNPKLIHSMITPDVLTKDIVNTRKFIAKKEAGSKKQSDDFYITKDGDDFRYKGKLLKLSKNTTYFKVFCALFDLIPEGGEIGYKELAAEVKSRIPATKKKTLPEMRKFIQSKITEKTNGFKRHAQLPETEDNGKALIVSISGSGIEFNNRK